MWIQVPRQLLPDKQHYLFQHHTSRQRSRLISFKIPFWIETEWRYLGGILFADHDAWRDLNLLQVRFWEQLWKQHRRLHLYPDFMQNFQQLDLGINRFFNNNLKHNDHSARPGTADPILEIWFNRIRQSKINIIFETVEHYHYRLKQPALLLLVITL